MSWIDHLNAQLVSKGVSACALLGAADGAVWADHGSGLSAGEAQNIAKLFSNPASAFATGVMVGGVKFFCTRASDDTIAARKDQRGLFLCKSDKAIVVALHDETMNAGTCSTFAGKAADYFRSLGF
ncbi:profilin [Monocercomonoides exilis]|uniref:profilin n=1 Tax=Monocercomonoides exilis TaxID=2049356 RepID=UPI00355AA2B2|nr:profilin [Monocercomonoides exilis]|eukprot:MONOS_9916.1-p1 / transcript=MONOS_9916.1 / gene=MONOS_9916 / organism=Monocercomonoides_exilis_PA203 / gene_product=profilin / transcript_product=profilin / location=Mono_scaffold00427:9215-9719(+) / protein_length=125 / sequence_SO=supercontig / SO=protein_coding / is_pseudo=false